MERKQKTAAAMVRLYCRAVHGGRPLCGACAELLQFAEARLRGCPFQAGKPICADCAVHCWQSAPELRERMRLVMRYAGPRMLLYHPWLALHHQLDKLRRR